MKRQNSIDRQESGRKKDEQKRLNRAQAANKVHNQWRAQCKFVVYFFKIRLESWDSEALRWPATAYAQTLAASLGNNETINNHPNSSISFELY